MKYIFGYNLDFFAPPFQTNWQFIIATLFVGISGFSSTLSKSPLKRFLKLLVIAIVITAVTWLARIDVSIYFGVIHCLSACAFIYYVSEKLLIKTKALPAAVLFILLYIFTYHVPHGYLQIPGLFSLQLPEVLYSIPGLFWIGFPTESFVSGDYFPLLPYSMLYFGGVFLGLHYKKSSYPAYLYAGKSKILTALSKHSLLIYLIHQPIIISILFFITIFQ